MNSLIIVAHPQKKSFSFAMANRYINIAKENNYNIDFIDLYREKNKQPFFSFEDANRLVKTKEMEYFQKKIQWADELVFIFPYWWGGMPSILKNFFEWNLSKGFAFTYVNSRPKGLLTNKSVKVYTTTGAPTFLYNISGANRRIRKTMQKQIFEFCGMKLTSFNIYGGIDKSATNPSEILKKMRL